MENGKAWKPKVIVFDVYETLLDMGDMERRINLITDSKRGYTIWFGLFMQYCFASNSLDGFQDFMSIAKATLQMTSEKLPGNFSEAGIIDVLSLLQHLPIHEEVQPVLSQLSDAGYTIAALTNTPEKLICDRMERTGLISYFEKVFSAESVKKYKPEKKVYEWAAQQLNADPATMLMVTAHDWDVAGAANAGLKTAYIKREKQMVYPLAPRPDFTYENLTEFASQLEKK